MATQVMHGRRGGDHRGNTQSRRRRKLWLLRTFGDGDTCRCFWCPEMLTYATVEADRHPIQGKDGGSYRRGNIVPACRRDNAGRYRRETPLDAAATM